MSASQLVKIASFSIASASQLVKCELKVIKAGACRPLFVYEVEYEN